MEELIPTILMKSHKHLSNKQKEKQDYDREF